MPTYEYACKQCGEHLEVVQSFTDDALTECPNCAGQLRKVFGSVGVTFKGSGFYKTDSRKPAPAAKKETAPASESSTPSETKSSENKSSENKSESTPAKTPEPKSTGPSTSKKEAS